MISPARRRHRQRAAQGALFQAVAWMRWQSA